MAVIETWYNQDLSNPVQVQYLHGNVFSQDNGGNLIGVNVYKDGQPATLSGSVSASVIRTDGATVAVSGGLAGNKANVVLPQAAYAVPGIISVVVKLTNGATVTTLCAVVANVYQSSTDTVVDPGTIIPDVSALIAAIDAAVASIPADYSSLWNATKQIGHDLNEKTVYMPGAESGYTTGAETTYLYILTNGNKPVLIPKGSTIARINFVNSSTYHHTVALYFFERQGWNFKCVRIIAGCNIDGSRILDIDASSFDTDVYIGIKNEIAYGIKFYEGTISDRTSGTLCAYNGTPSVGDLITPARDTNRYYAYNIRVDVFFPDNREENSYSGNNTFMFKNNDVVSEIQWITGKGFYNDTFDTATTVSNYMYVLNNSSVGDTSEPVTVRDNDGKLINNIKVSDVSSYPEAFLVAEFDRNGIYIRTLTAGDFASDGFSADCFYAVVRRFTNYDTRYYIENTRIAWLNAGAEEYTVGTGGDFETFTEMLIALKDNTNKKTVYISEGVYDIYEEMGGDAYLATITNPGALNWRDVCHVVPDNTTIIGIGKVVLTWEPSSSAVGSDAMAFLFSPLNLSGSATIENIEIRATNCRYAIHDETSSLSRWNNVNRKMKNVHAVHTNGTYHPTEQAYGAGIAPTGVYEFENCMFENDADWFIFSMHATNMTANDETIVNIKNCIIRNKDSMTMRGNDRPVIGFGSVSTEQRYIDVNISGCWLAGGVRKYPEGNVANIDNAFKLTMIGNNAVPVSSTTATDVLPVIKCNEFAN